MVDPNWFLKLKKNAVSRARRILYGARWAFVVNAKENKFNALDILPFDSRLNVYDRDIDRTIQAMLPSKGADAQLLTRTINEVLGRKALPESREEELLTQIADLKYEIMLLKDEIRDLRSEAPRR